MKHSIFALPALLRPALFLATASQSGFSVQDDLLAFPQYAVDFSEDFVLEAHAHRLRRASEARGEHQAAPSSQVEHYLPDGQRPDGTNAEGDEAQILDYEQMYIDGLPYICSIPQAEKKTAGSETANDTISKAEEEKELARATERGWELLSGMKGNCVYFISGWWSYKFCYNDGVRQFHQLPPSRGVPIYPPVEDPAVESYTLGMYQDGGEREQADNTKELSVHSSPTPEPISGELVQRGENRYLVQRLRGGTKCDLTGKDRRIEVQFHCNTQPPTDRISLIKETSTCAYLMVIHTPRLCNDVAFLPPQKDAPNSISCKPVLHESQVDDYKRDIAALNAADREAKIWESNAEAAKVFLGEDSAYQVVGDMIVGGRAIVPEDVKLEKSAIVGGGKDTYIDTIASSAGKAISKENIEKLGLGDLKGLEKLKKQLENLANGQEWKLDLVDTPRGKEFRGIIGDSNEGDDGDEKNQNRDEKNGPAKDGNGHDEGEGSKEEYFVKDEL